MDTRTAGLVQQLRYRKIVALQQFDRAPPDQSESREEARQMVITYVTAIEAQTGKYERMDTR